MVAQPAAPTRPTTLALNPDGVSTTLREIDQWCLFRIQLNKNRDKYTKPPYGALLNDTKIDITNPKNYATFAQAVDALQWGNYDGVGFAIRKENTITVVDFDHCRAPETGAIDSWATQRLRLLPNSYVEISITGTGLHAFVIGSLPADAGNKTGVTLEGAHPDAAIEMYDHDRYITITGHRIDDGHCEPGDGQEGIDALQAEFWPVIEKPERAAHLHIVLNDKDVLDRLELARNASNGATFRRRYDEGDWSGQPSPSEARWELLKSLAFWIGPDRHQVYEAFHASAMYEAQQERCEEKRGDTTLLWKDVDRAIADQTKFYAPAATITLTAADLPRPIDQVGELVKTGLPDDVAACHALIADLSARLNALVDEVAEVRAENAELRKRVDTAMQRVDEQKAKTRIRVNSNLGSERFTFAELVDYFPRRAKDADGDGFIPAPRETIANNTGFSETTVGKHIERGVELGLIEKTVKTVPGEYDPETRTVGDPKNKTFIRPASGIIDFSAAAAVIASEKKANHGGDRVGCIKHPHADVIVTTKTTKHCAECGELIEQPKTTRRRIKADAIDQVGELVDDLLTPTGTEGENGAVSTLCGLPRIVTESTICHNDNLRTRDLDTSGSVIADAWTHGEAVPKGGSSPPAQVAFVDPERSARYTQ